MPKVRHGRSPEPSAVTTIRQSMRGWHRFLGIGILIVGILASSWRIHTWFGYYLRMSVLAFLIITVVGVFAFGFVCPRCRRSLLFNSFAIFDGRPSKCPRCGVSMDDRIVDPAIKK
jgi:hypothetical protein